MKPTFFGTIAGGGAVTPISLVVSTKVAAVGAPSPVTTPAVDTTGATILIAHVGSYDPGGAVTVTDSKGNTWSPLTAHANGDRSQFFYAENPVVGSGHTFSISTTGQYSGVIVGAFDQVATASSFDQQNGANSASAATIATGSVTPSTNNQLIVAGVASDQASATINAGFTIIDTIAYNPGNAIGSCFAYLVQTTAAAVNPTWTPSGTGAVGASIATFKHS
jgi:hypothetical protein